MSDVGSAYDAAFGTAIGAPPPQQTVMPQLPTLPGQKRAAAPAPRPAVAQPVPGDDVAAPQAQQPLPPTLSPSATDAAPTDLQPSNPATSPTQAPTSPSQAASTPSNASHSAPPADVRAAIVQAAKEAGVNPAYALATASRESSFNPNEGGTGTIRGLYQMSQGIRSQYGIPDDANALEQSRGFQRFTAGMRSDMAKRLGRQPTDQEAYLGHYFGPGRAARMVSGMDPNTPVDQVFTPRELAGNPNIVRAGTVGALTGSVQSDMTRRLSTYGREDPGQGAAPQLDTSRGTPPQGEDFAQYAGGDDRGDLQSNFARNQAWTKKGASDFNTDLGSQEPAFRKWVADNKVPFDPDDPKSDYDMRGYWKASQDPAAWADLQKAGSIPADMGPASTKVDPNDNQPHYPDWWKTPYHETFSNQSQWATPDAPRWNDQDQLVAPGGAVLFDDRNRPQSATPAPQQPDANSGADPQPGSIAAPAGVAAPGDFASFGADDGQGDTERKIGLDSMATEVQKRDDAMQPGPFTDPAQKQRNEDMEINGLQDRLAVGTST